MSSTEPKTYSGSEWMLAGLILVVGIPIALWFAWGRESGRADQPSQEDVAQQEFLWIESAKDSVRSKLKDPESATFRNEAVRRQTGAPLVCGEVNARNSFGGAAGHQRFVFMGSQLGSVLEEEMAPPEFQKLWDRTCLR